MDSAREELAAIRKRMAELDQEEASRQEAVLADVCDEISSRPSSSALRDVLHFPQDLAVEHWVAPTTVLPHALTDAYILSLCVLPESTGRICKRRLRTTLVLKLLLAKVAADELVQNVNASFYAGFNA